MCFVSTPHLNTNPPPPEYLHNQYLDAVGPDGVGASVGRNNLRIDPTSSSLNAPTATTGAPSAGLNIPGAVPVAKPVGGPAPNPVASGNVTPTIGGSLAGAVPAYMRFGAS
jgi:hypothetical protein